MKSRSTIGVLLLLAAVGLSNVALAQDKRTGDAELAELKQQILDLKQQADETRRKHDSEIEALKEEVKKLGGPTGDSEEASAEDEMACLRALAESAAGEKTEQKAPEETVYKFGGLSLQKLNPEITLMCSQKSPGMLISEFAMITTNRTARATLPRQGPLWFLWPMPPKTLIGGKSVRM